MKKVLIGFAISMSLAACAATVGPDAVSFPTGYKSQTLVTTVDRADLKQVREIYVSTDAAKSARAGKGLPHGSVFTMEIYNARADGKGELAKDTGGRLAKGDLTAVFVMEKRPGFGASYGDDIRTGEWEYARFTPGGERVPNVDTKPCMQCHKPLAKQDFVFSAPRLTGASK